MKHLFTIHPEARREVLEGIAYLEEQRPGYGNLFNEKVDEAISRILENPTRYPKANMEGTRHRILLDKPFHKTWSIFYDFDGEMVYIISVFNNRRSTQVWEERE
ncbi:MAG: hypothetical protein KDE26_19910 [Bacteroidetes bacterium]|nr:hypothetical protein [Bacteroidota bacterium]